LVSSTHLPVSVWGTGGVLHRRTAFSCLPVPVTSCPCGHGIRVVNPLPPHSTQRLTFPRACRPTPHSGTGILTSCPSATPAGLALGPTNPTRTDLPSETLDCRRTWFSHVSRYSCQHSHSCTLQQPFRTAFSACRTLPYYCACAQSQASVGCFSPVTFSAQPRSTSELLRTLSRVAASKPTS
jgi:hypothetical protein